MYSESRQHQVIFDCILFIDLCPHLRYQQQVEFIIPHHVAYQSTRFVCSAHINTPKVGDFRGPWLDSIPVNNSSSSNCLYRHWPAECMLNFGPDWQSVHWMVVQTSWVYAEWYARPAECTLNGSADQRSIHWMVVQTECTLNGSPDQLSVHWMVVQTSWVYTEWSSGQTECALNGRPDWLSIHWMLVQTSWVCWEALNIVRIVS